MLSFARLIRRPPASGRIAGAAPERRIKGARKCRFGAASEPSTTRILGARSGASLIGTWRAAVRPERLSGAVGSQQFRTAARSVGSDDAELIPRWVLQHARRPVACFRARHERRAGSSHFVNEGLRVFHEEVEVNSSFGGLRFRNGLKGQERRSVRAPVSSLERHVRPPSRARSARVAETAFP